MMIVASITTIPPRVHNGNLRKCIDGLLDQTYRLDKIFIVIPRVYARFEEVVDELPDWFAQEPYASRIMVLRPEKDAGPISKYTAVGAYLNKNASEYGDPFVFVGDDDQVYHPQLIERMMRGVPSPDFKGVLQNRYEVVRYGTGGIIHGFVGLCVRASCLRALSAFPMGTPGFFVDDQVMSIYFTFYSVPMVPSGVIEYADIYKELVDGHEGGVHMPDALHMIGNRDACVAKTCDMYSTRFGYGGVVHIDWNSLYTDESIADCKSVRVVGPSFMVTELRKNVTSIRFCDSDSDGADALIYLSVGSKEYGVHNLKNHLKGLKEGSSVYLKVFECSLNDYDVLMDTYGSENVQHMLPSTFEIKCQKEGLLDLEEGGGLR